MLSAYEIQRAQTRAVLELLAEDFALERAEGVSRMIRQLDDFARGCSTALDLRRFAAAFEGDASAALTGCGFRKPSAAVILAMYHFALGSETYRFLPVAKWLAYARMFKERRHPPADPRDIAELYEKLEDNLSYLLPVDEVTS